MSIKLKQREQICSVIQDGELAGLGDYGIWENEGEQVFLNKSQVAA